MESLEDLVEKKGEVNFSPSVDSSLQKKFEDKYMIQSVLEKMSPDERIILTLREIEGLTYIELSQTLGISLDLVKVRLFRARESFLKIVKKFL